MSESSSLDEDMIAEAINFHGTDLMQKILNAGASTSTGKIFSESLLSNKNLDYTRMNAKVVGSRRNSDPKKSELRQKVHDLMLLKLPQLFPKAAERLSSNQTGSKPHEAKCDNNLEIDYTGGAIPSMAPLENFLNLSKKEEEDKFFTDARVGDVVYCRVSSNDDAGLVCKLLCTQFPFERDLEPLNLEVLIPKSNLFEEEDPEVALIRMGKGDASPDRDKMSRYVRRTLLKARIRAISREKHQMTLSITEDTSLGIVTETDLPPFFRNADKTITDGYDSCLRNDSGFRNPTLDAALCLELGLENNGAYWENSLIFGPSREKFAKDEFAEPLRKAQSEKMAIECVAKGVQLLKDGRGKSAMQQFEKALQIDPKNAEALVARGAVYANKEEYTSALADFESAVRSNPHHPNGRKYLIETLMASGKGHEQKIRSSHGKSKAAALRCYLRVLDWDPDHYDAKARLSALDPDGMMRSSVAASSHLEESTTPASTVSAALKNQGDRNGSPSKDTKSAQAPLSDVHIMACGLKSIPETSEGVTQERSPDSVEEIPFETDKSFLDSGFSSAGKHDSNTLPLSERLKKYYKEYSKAYGMNESGDSDDKLMKRLKEYYEKHQGRMKRPDEPRAKRRRRNSSHSSIDSNSRDSSPSTHSSSASSSSEYSEKSRKRKRVSKKSSKRSKSSKKRSSKSRERSRPEKSPVHVPLSQTHSLQSKAGSRRRSPEHGGLSSSNRGALWSNRKSHNNGSELPWKKNFGERSDPNSKYYSEERRKSTDKPKPSPKVADKIAQIEGFMNQLKKSKDKR